MDLVKALKVSASGLRAQTMRMRVSAENMANAETMGEAARGPLVRNRLRLEGLPVELHHPVRPCGEDLGTAAGPDAIRHRGGRGLSRQG